MVVERALERSHATWKIVYGHHPIRSHGRYGDSEELALKLLPILRGRADLYLAGHEHDLQILEPEDGLHFVISGAGGKSVRKGKPLSRYALSSAVLISAKSSGARGSFSAAARPLSLILRQVLRRMSCSFSVLCLAAKSWK